MKKNICLITDWYPTKENPYQGIFFKEQAHALENFNFKIVHYKEVKNVSLINYIVCRIKNENVIISKVNEEKNTAEYEIKVRVLRKNKLFLLLIRCLEYIYEKGNTARKNNKYQKRKKYAFVKAAKTKFFEDIDVLYCVSAQNESYILQSIANETGKPYIVSEHAPFPYPGTVVSGCEKSAIEQANLFLTISYDKIRQVLMQDIHPKKIAYVGNLIDEDKFLLSEGSSTVKTFIMVAANSFYKNYDLFIEIFNRLVEITSVPFKIMVVGYGANKGYSKNQEVLEKRILQSKFGNKAELIPEIEHEKISELYRRADAFVMTSIQEGMPVSALEAGCCGLPIFSTMCGGIEDYMDEKIGRNYKIIDSVAFAQGLCDFLEKRISFEKEIIREYIVNRYGKKAFVTRMTAIINDVIDHG